MSERASVDEIHKAVEAFAKGLPDIQGKSFDRVYAILKDLKLDSDGKIKPTVENLRLITKVNAELEAFADDHRYIAKVSELKDVISKVAETQRLYYASVFNSFTTPASIKELQKLTFNSSVDQLMGAGMQVKVVNHASQVVDQGIRDGQGFFQMVDQLKVKMLGDKTVEPRLLSYSKQTVNDTLSAFSRNYHNIVTDDLGLEWFVYLGALVDTSRPFCRALVAKKYVHKSELAAIASGDIDGVPVSLAGLMVGTNGQNLVNRCGGWNCNHQLIPVPDSVVPKEIRDSVK